MSKAGPLGRAQLRAAASAVGKQDEKVRKKRWFSVRDPRRWGTTRQKVVPPRMGGFEQSGIHCG